MQMTNHARPRARQRAIPPLVDLSLEEFGEAPYDGCGSVHRYFSKRSVRAMEYAFGRQIVRRIAMYLDAYRVESTDTGITITTDWATRHLQRR